MAETLAPFFTTMSDGSVRNKYTLKILNKRYSKRSFTLVVDGIADARASIQGQEHDGNSKIEARADDVHEATVWVTVPATAPRSSGRGQRPLQVPPARRRRWNRGHPRKDFPQAALIDRIGRINHGPVVPPIPAT
jgi:hypothetical protein